MTYANDSILVTPGSGATVATHTAQSKEHQVVMLSDVEGHIYGSHPIYFYTISSTVHVAAANTVMWDIWNGTSSSRVRVMSILQIPNITTAVTGVVFNWQLTRTTAIGTGGTAQTAWAPDTDTGVVPTLDASITCRLKPTGGATGGTVLREYSLSSEETNTATIQIASFGGLELIPPHLREPMMGHQGLVLRPSEGLRCVQVTSSAAGNTGWLIAFKVD